MYEPITVEDAIKNDNKIYLAALADIDKTYKDETRWKFIRDVNGLITGIQFDCPLGDMYGSLILRRFEVSLEMLGPSPPSNMALRFIDWFSDDMKFKFLMPTRKHTRCVLSRRLDNVNPAQLSDPSDGYDVIDWY